MSDDTGLFAGVLARGPVADAVSDRGWVAAMLDVEAALARAGATAGLIPPSAAEAIGAACQSGDFDAAALGAQAAVSGNPVVPLVSALTRVVPPDAAGYVHLGATSQDILDTAAMLVADRALGHLEVDLDATTDSLAQLADEHRTTLLPGRTLLQHALPATFGLIAAGWLSGLAEAATRLGQIRRTRLAVQLGGAAGTLASLGNDGTKVTALLANELGLADPILPWHTDRTRVAELAGALGVAAGAIAKIAKDIVLLAQTEVAEVRERGPEGSGGSSTLPQKQNPIAAICAVANARQAPGLVATLLAAMDHEHQRAAGAWHAEWRPLSELLRAAGSAAAWLRESLDRLEVDRTRMRANVDLLGDLLLAERVSAALAPHLGRVAAHEVVANACAEAAASGRALAHLVADRVATARPDLREVFATEELNRLLEPADYLGSSQVFIDRAVQAYRSRDRDGV
ncbi:MAG TPA: 3-carboxy-cis,cis-muconate cycloisomerase [Actinomycetes bacterium]|nr:3-carboxy-cis,cis-muconate cycloisomerase [Actinomycetes bacterium]